MKDNITPFYTFFMLELFFYSKSFVYLSMFLQNSYVS